LDVIVCFAEDPRLPRLFRRMVVSWDWGPSKLGRCPHDPPEYTGRAVDVAFWVIPDRPTAVAGLREWLAARLARQAHPRRPPPRRAAARCPHPPRPRISRPGPGRGSSAPAQSNRAPQAPWPGAPLRLVTGLPG